MATVEGADAIQFTNSYTAPPEEPKDDGGNGGTNGSTPGGANGSGGNGPLGAQLPQTGDMLAPFAVTVGLLAVVALAVALVARRRRNRV